mmetsp:Transcript_2390/g.7272  ORF Transcript_2390/g.7272 Transcript_2390/m.7272 type:complete len:1550 (+) Transcript_2390:101-4750(+)
MDDDGADVEIDDSELGVDVDNGGGVLPPTAEDEGSTDAAVQEEAAMEDSDDDDHGESAVAEIDDAPLGPAGVAVAAAAAAPPNIAPLTIDRPGEVATLASSRRTDVAGLSGSEFNGGEDGSGTEAEVLSSSVDPSSEPDKGGDSGDGDNDADEKSRRPTKPAESSTPLSGGVFGGGIGRGVDANAHTAMTPGLGGGGDGTVEFDAHEVQSAALREMAHHPDATTGPAMYDFATSGMPHVSPTRPWAGGATALSEVTPLRFSRRGEHGEEADRSTVLGSRSRTEAHRETSTFSESRRGVVSPLRNTFTDETFDTESDGDDYDGSKPESSINRDMPTPKAAPVARGGSTLRHGIFVVDAPSAGANAHGDGDASRSDDASASESVRAGVAIGMRKFVYVPADFQLHASGALKKVFDALELDEPQLSFLIDRCDNGVTGRLPITDKSFDDDIHDLQECIADFDSLNGEEQARDELDRQKLCRQFADLVEAASAPPHPRQQHELVERAERRLQGYLEGITHACEDIRCVHLMMKCTGGNRLCELLLDSTTDSTVTLGAYVADELSYVSTGQDFIDAMESRKVERATIDMFKASAGLLDHADAATVRRKINALANRMYRDPKGLKKELKQALKMVILPLQGGHRTMWTEWDTYYFGGLQRDWRRVPIGDAIRGMTMPFSTPTDVDKVLDVSTATPLEKAVRKVMGTSHVNGGLINRHTHTIVFHNKTMRSDFGRLFHQTYKAGVLAAGGKEEVIARAEECLRSSLPLFVFAGTGGASDDLAKVLRYWDAVQDASRLRGPSISEAHRQEVRTWLRSPWPSVPHERYLALLDSMNLVDEKLNRVGTLQTKRTATDRSVTAKYMLFRRELAEIGVESEAPPLFELLYARRTMATAQSSKSGLRRRTTWFGAQDSASSSATKSPYLYTPIATRVDQFVVQLATDGVDVGDTDLQMLSFLTRWRSDSTPQSWTAVVEHIDNTFTNSDGSSLMSVHRPDDLNFITSPTELQLWVAASNHRQEAATHPGAKIEIEQPEPRFWGSKALTEVMETAVHHVHEMGRRSMSTDTIYYHLVHMLLDLKKWVDAAWVVLHRGPLRHRAAEPQWVPTMKRLWERVSKCAIQSAVDLARNCRFHDGRLDFEFHDGLKLLYTFPDVESYTKNAKLVMTTSDRGQAGVGGSVDEVTKVMGAAFDDHTDPGEQDDEQNAVQNALIHQAILEKRARHYWNMAVLLQLMLHLLVLATTVVSVVYVTHFEDREDKQDEQRDLFRTIVLLPLLVVALSLFYAAYRPVLKFGACLTAAKRIERETFMYRTKVSPYRSSMALKGSRREVYAERCQKIWDEVAESDMKEGAFADSCRWRKSFLSEAFDTLASEDGTRLSQKQVQKLAQLVGLSEKYPVHTPIGMKTYIRIRINQQLTNRHRTAASTKMRHLFAFAVVVALNTATAAMVPFKAIPYVPVVLAVVAAIEFFSTFYQLERQVIAMNVCAQKLSGLLTDWHGLQRIKRRLPSNKDWFVREAEQAILSVHEGFASAAIALAKEEREAQLANSVQTMAPTKREAKP